MEISRAGTAILIDELGEAFFLTTFGTPVRGLCLSYNSFFYCRYFCVFFNDFLIIFFNIDEL
jgi:hypothetical protein